MPTEKHDRFDRKYHGAPKPDADLQVDFGMIQEEVFGERIHALTSKEDDVVTAVDGDVDGGIGIASVAPVHGSVGVAEGKAQLGGTVDVDSIHGELAGIGDGSGEALDPKKASQDREQDRREYQF